MDMSLISSNITIILLIGLAAFFLFYALIGLIVGMKKSIYRLITFVIYLVLIVALSFVFINVIFSSDISFLTSSINLPENVNGNTIDEIATSFVTSYVGNSDANALNLVLSLVSVILRIIYIILMVFIVYPVYWLITQIIWLIFFKRDKDDESNVKKPEQKEKPKKYRFFGFLINGAKGALIFVLITTVCLSGPISMIPNFVLDENFTMKSNESSDYDRNNLIETRKAINNYKNSPFYILVGGDNDISFNSLVNDFVYYAHYKNYSFNLRKEIKLIGEASENFYNSYLLFNNEEVNITNDMFDDLSNGLKKMSKSEFINALMPVASGILLNQENIAKMFPEDFDYSNVVNIDWEKDFNTLAEVSLEMKDVADFSKFKDGFKLSLLNGVGVEKVFETLSEVNILNSLFNVALASFFNTENLEEVVGELNFEFTDIDSKQEIINFGKILASLTTIGIDTLEDLQSDDFIDKINLNAVGNVLDNIFSSKLFSNLVVQIVKNTINKSDLNESIKAYIDFDSIKDDEWEQEIVALLEIFKEADKNGALKIFDDNGNLDLSFINNISTETLLSSKLIRNFFIKTIIDAKEGKGILSSLKHYIKIPNDLLDAYSNKWYSYNYKCRLAYDNYEIGDIISKETFDTLTNNKTNWLLDVNEGELLNFTNAFKALINDIDLDSIINGSELLNFTNMINSLKKETISKISNSYVLNGTFTSVILEAGGENLIIPKDATNKEFNDYLMLNNEEFNSFFDAILDLELIKDGTMINLSNSDNYGLIKENAVIISESLILRATTSKIIEDESGTLPDDTYGTLKDINDQNINVIKKEKLADVVDLLP